MSNTVEYYAPIALTTTRALYIATSEDTEEFVEVDVELKWADDMIGVIPMFDSLESAKAYAGNNVEIIMFEGPHLEEADNAEKEAVKD